MGGLRHQEPAGWRGHPILGADLKSVLKSSSRLARLARDPVPHELPLTDVPSCPRYGAASWDCGGRDAPSTALFTAASPISRAPSSLALRFDITSAIDGRGKGPGIRQDTEASHVRRCTPGGWSTPGVGRNRHKSPLGALVPLQIASAKM